MDALQLYNALIDTNPQIDRKGKTTPYTSINGHMFSFLSKEGVMGLRLSNEDRAQFMKYHDTPLMQQHGRLMKEYDEIPQDVLLNTNLLSEYLQKSLNYVSGLKPKPSKK